MSKSTQVKARQVLDCKGRPVAEVDILTESGELGRAGASTGSSVGANESFVLRDGDPQIYGGLSVYKRLTIYAIFWLRRLSAWTYRIRRPLTVK